MKLIPEANAWWRMWSVRLGLLGSVIVSLLVAIPDWAITIWATLPDEIKAMIPPNYMPFIGVAISLCGLVARFIQQEKVRLAGLAKERQQAEAEAAKAVESAGLQ